MRTRRLPALGLAALTSLLLGCQQGGNTLREEQEVPQGAIPAAPDVRPGTETAAPGGVAQPGIAPVQDTMVGAQQPVEAPTRVVPDTVRRP